ncbi:MAG: family 10 glycosylhydrolase [Tannerellaceae bacterium]|jgi:uncharacterized lipoprotein YddW (UPF0748 family)|nr:family 10 glycosylhydrolase [Tannerellaceae bacterium]
MGRVHWLFFVSLFLPVLHAANPPKQEIRAVWLTTIHGLDWPSKPATDEASRLDQQKELCGILDRLKEANFNCVFLQVRLRGDVIYPSSIEPFNKVFSGKTDVSPGYDPLAFAVEECHNRGMECHAWLVTFPLGTVKSVNGQGKRSVVKRNPGLCKQYNDEWFLDPGIPETTGYILSLVKEIVNGYDVDGIHFDYIRYPEKAEHFPDKKVYARYGQSKKIDDWRRDNINRMVIRIYDWVKEVKPWVQVSSSPLGKYSRIRKAPDAGWTAYESVFQDPQNWMKEGKHDMIVPMMYYKHNHFFPFVDNWMENSNGRLVVPGLGAYRMIDIDGNWTADDITEQLEYSRKAGTAGSTFFRSAHILNNTKGLYDLLKTHYFRYPAQLPPLTWLSHTTPPAPGEVHVEWTGNGLKLSWRQPGEATDVLTYTVYGARTASVNTGNPADILATGLRKPELFIPIHAMAEQEYTFCVTASDRYHTESMPSRETYYYLSPFPK